ncbi:MAG: penicillin-binding protein 2 [Actinobacteria bacterium]|nr:penicillin-binding protein 2 [Actinomycetota bacterium]MCG2817914.1 penicillin-binding protein 2 [Actinomycetes bacterium]MBU4178564.1 penicillin-binding protein 2 [Actinomycetota bacterium]MBU4219749.1 penicillin-binding protein 2 [Actinomycetota bacterium]MBU4357843.1 penicillin-binding protein 2 [Actinomycetota bacterium]
MRLLRKIGIRVNPNETTQYRPDAVQEKLQRRLTILGILIVAAFVILFARLWFMQIVSGDEYCEKAEGNRIREMSLESPRGRILDRNGTVLVKNRNALTISVVPAEIGKDEKVIERLSRLLGMGEKEIRYRIEQSQAPNRRVVLIKSDVGEDVVTYVREHQREFPGVIAGIRPIREYPYEELAAHVIGYLGEISPEMLEEKKGERYVAGDEIGISGLESTYDEELRGEVGKYRLEVDASGNSIRELSRKEPRSGLNLRMTIDQEIQALVEATLKAQVDLARNRYHPETAREYEATGASAVVMDLRNGEIIAMASYPTFNLNEFVGGISEKAWKELNNPKNMYPLNNRAIMSELPPASTFKAVTAIGAIQEATYSMNSPFECKNVFTKGPFEEYPKYCWSTHGRINLFNGIVQSCDIVFYELGYTFYQRQLKEEGRPLWEYARDFRLGMHTGIDLTSEMDGRVPSPEWKREFNRDNPEYQVWYPGDTVNMAIGQGDLLATPLQMAYVFAGIANGGKFVKPHVMKDLEDSDGEVSITAKIETVAELEIDVQIFAQINEALQGVVKGKGTASKTFEGFPLAQIPVAGKTGTAEVVGKQPASWFVCYAPANDPQYVVAVVIEQGGHGGETAAPAARRILEGLFHLPPAGEIQPSVGD